MEFHWFPELIAKFIGGVAAIGCGLSLGREGPSIQIGAYVGDGVSSVSRCTHPERKYLLTAGASAGLAAAFNAPLAGVLFAIEELHKSISPRMLTCTFLGSIGGEVVSKYIFGLHPIFNFQLLSYLPVQKYPVLIGLGLLCGVGGAIFNKSLLFALDLHDRYIPNDFFRPLPIMLLAGVLGFFLPQVLGGGHELIMESTRELYGVQFLLVILVVKFILTSLSYGTGAPGGIFLPLLVIGALLGRLYSDLFVVIFNWDSGYRINFVILGMTAFFSAVVQAPITGSVLLAEMVGSLQHFTSLVTISAVAYISAELFSAHPIYEVFLHRLLRKGSK
jgi:H+/Cl- antiporter ClcA